MYRARSGQSLEQGQARPRAVLGCVVLFCLVLWLSDLRVSATVPALNRKA